MRRSFDKIRRPVPPVVEGDRSREGTTKWLMTAGGAARGPQPGRARPPRSPLDTREVDGLPKYVRLASIIKGKILAQSTRRTSRSRPRSSYARNIRSAGSRFGRRSIGLCRMSFSRASRGRGPTSSLRSSGGTSPRFTASVTTWSTLGSNLAPPCWSNGCKLLMTTSVNGSSCQRQTRGSPGSAACARRMARPFFSRLQSSRCTFALVWWRRTLSTARSTRS